MPHILHLDASARPGLAGKDQHGSHSRNLTQRFVSQWLARRGQDSLTYRDIGQNPPSIINHDWIASSFTPAQQREPWMRETLAESDTLVDELIAADVLVIGAPLYNFSIPSQLKAWIDRLAQAGRTFKYTDKGPVGLAGGKTVIVASTRGGVYSTSEGGQAMEHQESYLKVVFGFFGITDVRFVRAEGVAMGPDAKAAALASAEVEITNHTGAAANQASVAQAA